MTYFWIITIFGKYFWIPILGILENYNIWTFPLNIPKKQKENRHL